MEERYVYIGNEAVGRVLEPCLEKAGYTRVNKVGEASIVVTYCTSQTVLEDAYFDEKGIVQQARPHTLLVDLSASTPNFARELSAIAEVSDLMVAEAPLVVDDICHPDAFARKDNLMCLLAGEESSLEGARSVLDILVGNIHYTGDSGSAQLARAAYTLQTSAQIMAAVEADALYSSVRSTSVSLGAIVGQVEALTPEVERVLTAIREGRFEGAYTVEMLMAELSAALMAADDVDLILPQAEACLHLLELIALIGGADKTPASLALVYGDEAACAQNGLDWTRAEQAYSGSDDVDREEGIGSDEDDYPAGFGAYSVN